MSDDALPLDSLRRPRRPRRPRPPSACTRRRSTCPRRTRCPAWTAAARRTSRWPPAVTRPTAGSVYARLWNPTVARFETALAALEHTAEAVAFSSGHGGDDRRGPRGATGTARPGSRAATSWRSGRSTAAPTTCSPPACSASRSRSAHPDEVAARAPRRHLPGRARDPGQPDPRAGRHRGRRRGGRRVGRCWSTTPSPPRCCRTRRTRARPWSCTAPPSTSAATATWSAAWWPATRSGRPRCAGSAPSPAACCTRSAPTCCTAACRPCRCGCAPSRRRRRRSPAWLGEHPAVRRVHYPGTARGRPGRRSSGRQMRGPGAMLALAARGGFDAAQPG